MRKISHILAAGAAGMLAIFALAGTAQAETVIDNGYLAGDAVWTASSGPYLIEDTVTVPAGHSLEIGPGTAIIASSSLEGYPAFYVQGNFSIDGTSDSHISLTGPGSITIDGGSASLHYTEVSLHDGIGVFNGYAIVSSSTISGASQGLHIQKSRVSVKSSRISNNGEGIYVARSPGGIFEVRNAGGSHQAGGTDGLEATGGIGNALETASMPLDSDVSISDSILVNNSRAAVMNNDTQTVMAAGNWWGSDGGPMATSTNGAIGAVTYSPWLTKDPLAESDKQKCCSSILFIPGLEGTRLYRPEPLPLGLGSMTNRLWEPNRNADITKLYLNPDGTNPDSTIYSGGPIDRALGFKDVYGGFINFLDGLARDGTVNEWKAFGYDWRKPIDEVVAGAEKKATTTESLVATVEDMASRSKTGKVNIVAHSNGGLVAKYLVKTLADIGKSSLIDTVISVAVPYLGTPEAIAGLLHGDDQSILGGLIATKAVARGLGQNMASAYSLLPSTEYFAKIFTPTIVFASTTIPGVNEGVYPRELSSHDSQSAFILDSYSARTEPTFSNVKLPSVGNALLMAAADAIHAVIDPFIWPATIARYAIVGWGKDTVSNILYSAAGHKDRTTTFGDGTVVAPSAAYDAGTTTSIDLASDSRAEGRTFDHTNILQSSTTQSAIAKIVSKETDSYCQDISKLRGASCGEPDYSKVPTSLVLSTHSPVELHVYDSQGRHAGLIPKPAGLDEDVEDGLYSFSEANIPGSSFEVMGTDEEPEDYVYLPDDGQKYTVEIRGTGVGTFSYEVERQRNGLTNDLNTLGHAEYDGIPVTPITVATTSLQLEPVGYEATSTAEFTAKTRPLSIDIDGDGSPDAVATPSISKAPALSARQSLALMKESVVALGIDGPDAKKILKKIDDLERAIESGKPIQMRAKTAQTVKKIGHIKSGQISDSDRKTILEEIDAFMSEYE